MATSASPLPRHRLTSLLDPRSLLVMSDRTLPVSEHPPAALQGRCVVVDVVDGQSIELPWAGEGISSDRIRGAGGAGGDSAKSSDAEFRSGTAGHGGDADQGKPGAGAGVETSDDGRPPFGEERLDLAIVCVPPARLVEAFGALRPLRPQSVLVLRHDTPSAEPAEDMAFCRSWGLLNDCVVLGPGSFGLQRPHRGFNFCLDSYPAPAGRVALVAQSPSIMAAVLDWAEDISLGFSALVSIGVESAVDLSEVLDYLSMDNRTDSIVLYLEHPSSSRSFTSAVRAAASVKPVVVLKTGRRPVDADPAQQQIAAAQTAVFNAVVRRVGAVRVRYFIQLFSALKVLVHGRRPRGRRIAILSNGRAAAQLALDVMGPDSVVYPAELSQATVKALTDALEPAGNPTNPVVTTQPLQPDSIEQLVRLLADDAGVDGVLVLIAPDPYADLAAVADRLAETVDGLRKPLVSCFMGDAGMRGLRKRMDQAGAPAFRTPESAVDAFGLLSSYHYSQTLAQQTLPPEPLSLPPKLDQARDLLRRVQNERRSQLTVDECRELLECFYIPIDYVPDPGVVTIHGPTEVPPMAIRMQRDDRFGPYIAFGAGQKAEWVADSSRAVDLPPLNRYLARQLVQRSALWRRVLSRQLSPAALELLHESLERISELISELPTLDCITIDPLFAGDRLLRAGNVRISIRPESMLVLPETTGYRHLAIHPYPRRLVQEMHFANGDPWLLRPIRPEDAEPLQDFVRNLSDESRYMRFVSMLRELTPRMLARYTSIDYDRELALVATVSVPNPEHRGYPKETIIGFAHYLRNADGRGAEYALAIADDWQRKGLGAQLMRGLIEAAQIQGLTYIDGFVLANNRPMLGLMGYLGFRNDPDVDDPGMRRVWLDLGEVRGRS